MKKYLIFDLDGTLIESHKELTNLITKYFFENFWVEKDEVKYYLSNSRWTWLPKQVEKILWKSPEESKKIADDIYKKINNLWNSKFFDGVPEKIKELSKKYILFLSTWNSTTFAENNLKNWEIYDCFEYILWSEKTPKSDEHIKIFKEIVWDDDFEKKSIFIWDGEKDREIAKKCAIDFVHIDENLENNFWDKYEIKSVALLSDILNSNF